MSGTVLVTGASGFVGGHLVQALAEAGWKVRAAARNPAAITGNAATERVAIPDLAHPIDWRPLLDGVTHIVHLAGLAHTTSAMPESLYLRVNAECVAELAKAAARVNRIVFLSSIRAQTGLSAAHVLRESDAPEPTDIYGRSKLAAERMLEQSAANWTVLRPVAIYGKGVKANLAALATLARTPMPLPFAGLDNRRSLLAVENLTSAIIFLLGSDKAARQRYLVADAEPVSIAELVTMMREALGRSPNLVRVPPRAIKRLLGTFGKEEDFERLTGHLVVEIEKLRGLGWEPRLSTREGIRRMMS